MHSFYFREEKHSFFSSDSFVLKFIFFSTKSKNSLTLKRHNSFQKKKKNRTTTHNFAARPLIFKLQQKFKIQSYLRELELPRN